MKQFLSWFGKRVASAVTTAILFILAVLGIVYAISYPGAPPAGEVAGGKFQGYFNQIFGALVFTGGTVQIAHVATENTACTPSGIIARDSNGLILSCQGGVWKKATGSGGGLILWTQIQSLVAGRSLSMTSLDSTPYPYSGCDVPVKITFDATGQNYTLYKNGVATNTFPFTPWGSIFAWSPQVWTPADSADTTCAPQLRGVGKLTTFWTEFMQYTWD